MLVSVGVLGFSFQLARVLTDAVLQGGVADESLGRAFAVYDIAYSLAFVAAGLAVVPLWSVASPGGLLAGIAGIYLVAAATTIVSRVYGAARSLQRSSRLQRQLAEGQTMVDGSAFDPHTTTTTRSPGYGR